MTTSFGYAVQGSGIVIGNNATVRSGSDFDQPSMGSLPIGTVLTILGENNGWYQINASQPKANGWIFSDLVALQETTKEKSVTKAQVTASLLNVRTLPSTDAHRMTQLRNGQEIQVIGTKDEWSQITMSDGQRGWVHSEYIEVIPNLPRGAVNLEKAAVYAAAAMSGQPIETLEKGAIVYIKNYDSGFYYVLTETDSKGWITRDHVSLIINGNNPVSRGGFRDTSSFISTTKAYLGSRYSYGATGPSRFDCSGFVYYITHNYYGDLLKENNISLPRSSRTMARVGTAVSRNNLEVGDLVFFKNTSGTINHVGFYIGNDQFIHASSGASMSVIISSLNESNYARRYDSAKRLFN